MGRIRPWKNWNQRIQPRVVTSVQRIKPSPAKASGVLETRETAIEAEDRRREAYEQLLEESEVLADEKKDEPKSAAARLARAKQENKPHFRLGIKQIWLPDFKVTFIRTPELHPRFAKFLVPLEIGKLDFRDFLWHGYQTRAINIRSWVYQRPVEYVDQSSGKAVPRWHRRKALKYMIVEMDEPFVWPKMPKDTSMFDKEIFNKMRNRAIAKDGKGGREDWETGTDFLKKSRETLRKEAASLLAGETTWRPTHEIYARPRQWPQGGGRSA